MSFIGGLAASPDPSADVVYENHQEPQQQQAADPIQLLLHDAWNDAQHFRNASLSTDEEEQNQEACLPSFDYSHRGLQSLPAELVDIIKDQATRLAFNHNRLTSLSNFGPRIGELNRLTYLVLRNNDLREFPRDILSCPSLETLDLHSNHIQYLPDDLSRLRNLKKLALDRNKVVRIPTCVARMTSLNWFSLLNNPVEFPEKSSWKVTMNNRGSEDGSRGPNWDKVMEETKRLKRALLQYERTEKSPESEQSEATTDTPKPVRKKIAGRFPVRPSLSGVDVDAMAPPPLGSPLPARPTLKSSKTTMVPPMAKTSISRPGIEPLVSKDRHRSNSESQMTTSRRQKRMGVHVSRGGNSSGEYSLEGSVDLTSDRSSSHARGTSAGSLLHQAMSANAITDSSAPQSPVDISRNHSFHDVSAARLSSLPENKRKSRADLPELEVADSVQYTISNVEAPLRKLVAAIKPMDPRRRSLDRLCRAAFANNQDLAAALRKLDSFDEEDGDMHQSTVQLHERCERAMSSFQQLLDTLQAHISVILEYSRPRDLRMAMHMSWAGIVEFKQIWSQFSDIIDEEEPMELMETQTLEVPEPTPQPIRQASPSPRPVTSLRIKDRNRPLPHHRQASSVTKPVPSPRSARSTSGSTLLSRAPSYASTSSRFHDYAPPTPSLTHTDSFRSAVSTETDDEQEDRQFEQIFESLNKASSASLESLRLCRKISEKTRDKQRNSAYGVGDEWNELLRNCDYAIEACKDLITRLKTMKVREPHARTQTEFWQSCTGFTKAFTMFARSIRDARPPVEIPEELKTLLRPVYKAVRTASTLIESSPWRDLAVHGPSSAGPSPAVHGHMPFSMSNPNPPPVPPPAKDLPPRPNHNSPYNGLGLRTSWGSSASLNTVNTYTSSTGTLRGTPTSYPRENGATSTTPKPSNLSRSSSRAGNYNTPSSATNPNYANGSYFADATPTDSIPSVPNSARFPPPEYRNGTQFNVDTRYDSRYAPSLPELSPHNSNAGSRSGYSSGYTTPMPPTPMTASLGPAAQATMTDTGTMRKVMPRDDGSHSYQNSFDNVVTGYGGASAYTNGTSNGYANSYGNGNGTNTWYGDLSGGPGATVPAARAINGGRPNPIERSVSAAGYYPSAVPSRMASRNVSRSASQRR